jgi:selenocysteine lyase/cysteine desulfurase
MLNAIRNLTTTFMYHDAEKEEAFQAFERAYPEFRETNYIDRLRHTDYSRLDDTGQIYLDYTGGGLYGASQLTKHMSILSNSVLGNPHSTNPSSMAMTQMDEHARQYVLKFFNADPDEYTVIFTPNASGALKLVGEAYPFNSASRFLITFDNHNSVNGIREFAHKRGAQVTYMPVVEPELRVDANALFNEFNETQPDSHNLFAYPAQSNFTGVQHPLEWVEIARSKGWDVLVDCAAFAPTNRIDLSIFKPDFMSLSFYKIFGYPTGVGALIARREKLQKLIRPWYAGGTITFSSVQGEGHYLTPGESGFEDGTINYLTLPAIEIGLKHIEAIGIDAIHTRVMCLTSWLIKTMQELRHGNGRPMIQIYGPAHTKMRGGTIAFNLIDVDGEMINCDDVETEANKLYISLRAGCHCNPGAREVALGFSESDMIAAFKNKDGITFDEFIAQIDGKTTGVVRASFGIATNFADVFHFVQFLKFFTDKCASDVKHEVAHHA